ncbi:MAG TPA: XRE family transcriptional regulator [Streptosporangiaceae bacterium]|nr:XRE family transcriptional regulator [Streptosporangiaceae bacterium]
MSVTTDPPAQRAQAGTDLAGDIGRRLATHRNRRGMRVADLAREIGVTPSLISQIERGLSRPSVSTLFAIAQALDVPVDAFFREPPPVAASAGPDGPPGAGGPAARGDAGGRPSPGAGQGSAPADGRYVVRRGGRAVIDIEGGVRWERLTRSTLDHLDFFELVYEPGAESHPRQFTHPGTEMVLVMSGCLEITIGFEAYLLKPGDSIDFPSSMPHRYLNPGTDTARAVTVILYDCPAGPGQPPPEAPGR